MKTKEKVVDYLELHLEALRKKREELHTALERTSAAISSISDVIQYFDSDEAQEIDSMLSASSGVFGPDDLRRPRYKDMSLSEAISKVFWEQEDRRTPLSIEELTEKLYAVTLTDAPTVKACRASLTAALYRMTKNGSPEISKVRKGVYKFNPQAYEERILGIKYHEIK
ncbi:hypothetical protein [Adonisia turfae]|uniref:Uncharacterized protein n=1 Tax=Adonisia turfae CCMR0081 TaxID=2292702 RepID=A0A6M0RH56_9CYAN|nr:hypothetical protein [Adonisia turfae]NEZ55479.1 hypothetical protein [Adonisia turfae CCMR0081]